MNGINSASIQLNGAVAFNGDLPLDAKLLVDTKADLKAVEESSDYAEGSIVYCKEDKSYYKFSAEFSESETGFFKKLFISTEAPVQGENLTTNPLVLTADGDLRGGVLQATITERDGRASGSINFANFVNSLVTELPTSSGITSSFGSISLDTDTTDKLEKISGIEEKMTQLEEKLKQLEESQVVPEEKDEILVTTMEEFNRLKEAGELTQEVIFIKEV